MEVIWLASIYDTLHEMFADKKHPYEPVASQYLESEPKEKKQKIIGFDSPEDFDRAREEILQGVR